jgi:hypothetical protein
LLALWASRRWFNDRSRDWEIQRQKERMMLVQYGRMRVMEESQGEQEAVQTECIGSSPP